jgi:CTP synthase
MKSFSDNSQELSAIGNFDKLPDSVDRLLDLVKKRGKNFFFVTGGVCSSLGKGVLVSSIGVLLKGVGYKVSVVKCDPYLNVDPGTISPLEHGELFVTRDGAETDLDLGRYERVLGMELDRLSSVSSGQIFQEILEKERGGDYLGKTIQFVPHVVNAIKKRLLKFAVSKDVDFVLVEIGGTVGDMEGMAFLEALREMKVELGKLIFHAHLSLVPVLPWNGEVKTKPTQHSMIL